jgi:hypothetical protein
MTQELYYTSAPRGLLSGTGGFCTVAATPHLSPALLERLESLSSYRPLFPPHHARAVDNPIVRSHLRVSVSGRTYSLLSRIAPAPLDHTGRTNLFAHHVVLDGNEMPEGGPAWLLQHERFRMETGFHGEPRYLETRQPPHGEVHTLVARTWKNVTGDEGWAGVLAERFEQEPNRPVYLVFEPGRDPLPLLAEALALLAADRRWEATFSTYFTALPPGVTCIWRCVPRGSEEAKNALLLPNTVNLCAPLGPAPSSALVETARTGKRPVPWSRRAVEASTLSPPAWSANGLPHRPEAPFAGASRSPHAPREEADSLASASGLSPAEQGELERASGRLLPFLGGLVLGAVLMFGVALALWYLPGTHERNQLQAERDELQQQGAARAEKIAELEQTLVARKRRIEALQQERKLLPDTFEKSSLPEGVRAELAAVMKEPARGTRQVQERMTSWAVGLMRQAAASEKERLIQNLESALKRQKFQGKPLPLDRDLLARDPGKAVTQTISGLKKRAAQRRPDVRDRVLDTIKQALHKNNRLVSEIDFALRGEKVEKHLEGIGRIFKEWSASLVDAGAHQYKKCLDAEDKYDTLQNPDTEDDKKRQVCVDALLLCDEILKNEKGETLAHRKAEVLAKKLDLWQHEHDPEKWSRRHPMSPPRKRD